MTRKSVCLRLAKELRFGGCLARLRVAVSPCYTMLYVGYFALVGRGYACKAWLLIDLGRLISRTA